MIYKIMGAALLTLISVLPMQAKSFEDHVREHYKETVKQTQESGIQGEMAKEIVQYALIRQIHEDGTDRPCDWSIPGIGTGGWNSEVMMLTLKRINPTMILNHCYDSDGMRLYTLKGEKANQVSAAVIANLFDLYPSRLSGSFSARQRDVWRVSRAYSYLLLCKPDLELREDYDAMREEREKIVQKCNRMYGPGAERIEGEVRKLQSVFKEME